MIRWLILLNLLIWYLAMAGCTGTSEAKARVWYCIICAEVEIEENTETEAMVR